MNIKSYGRRTGYLTGLRIMKNAFLTMFVAVLLVPLLIGIAGCSKGEPAEETKYTLKLAYIYPNTVLHAQVTEKFAEIMAEETDGRVIIETYPAGALFSLAEEWDAVTTGAVDMIANFPYFWIAKMPFMKVVMLPGLWDGGQHMDNFYRSPDVLTKVNTTLEPLGAHVLGMTRAASWSFYVSRQELTKRTDMAGLRYGLRSGSTSGPLPQYSGSIVVELPETEMISALQTKTVDILTLAAGRILSEKPWDYGAGHIFASEQMALGWAFVINKDKWESLDTGIRSIIETKVIPRIQDHASEVFAKDDQKTISDLSSLATTYHAETPEQRAEMWEVIQEYSSVQADIALAGADFMALIDSLRP